MEIAGSRVWTMKRKVEYFTIVLSATYLSPDMVSTKTTFVAVTEMRRASVRNGLQNFYKCVVVSDILVGGEYEFQNSTLNQQQALS
jgi:hypothetical protein